MPLYRKDKDGNGLINIPGYQRDPDEFWVRDPDGKLVIHDDRIVHLIHEDRVIHEDDDLIIHEDDDGIDRYLVRRFRPRIEGLFARIERWSKIGSPNDVHWRSISRDNILTLYGVDDNSRITNPENSDQIFSWLICEKRDDKGNGMRYRYRKEDELVYISAIPKSVTAVLRTTNVEQLIATSNTFTTATAPHCSTKMASVLIF